MAGIVVAAAGLFLLHGATTSFGKGELLTLGCAFFFAVHIVLLADFAPRHDPVRLNAVQLTVVGAGCLVPGFFTGGYDFPVSVWLAAFYTGVAASAVAFGCMVWAQRRVGPSRTALLLMLEPVFAAVVGTIAGEHLGLVGATGAALILAGILRGPGGDQTPVNSTMLAGPMADPTAPRPAFAPWDRRELPGLFDVEETARRVGNYKWVEMRLFEALGGWVATVPELDVKMRLGTHCYKHAWHADLWNKRLPELREMNPERLTQPANDDMVAFMDAVTEPEAPDQTIEKLVGVYRVLIPHKIAAYTYHLNNTSTITDAPTIRSLKFILNDELEDWTDGEMMLQSLIRTPEEVERAATRARELEKLIVEAGGIAGPGTLGEAEPEAEPATDGQAS